MTTITIGVTFERTQHSEIAVEPRLITKGGMIAAYGNRDLDHCLLDWAYRRGYLGNPQDSAERYSQGYRLRDLWFSFNRTGIPLEEMGANKSQYVSEGEVGKGDDYQRAMFNEVMKKLPRQHHQDVQRICIDDKWIPEQRMKSSLDALYGAFFRFDSVREQFDERIQKHLT